MANISVVINESATKPESKGITVEKGTLTEEASFGDDAIQRSDNVAGTSNLPSRKNKAE